MKTKLEENLNCEEIKEILIEQIRGLNCETLSFVAGKKMNFNKEFIYRQLAWEYEHPIPKEVKESQVSNARKYFTLFPEKFIINQFSDTVNLYRKKKEFMYIYFLYENGNVNIAFLFKNDFYRGEEFIVNTDDELYVLKNENLVHVEQDDYQNIKNSIVNFKEFFQGNYANFKFTKYIIFTMDLIDTNFSNFDNISELFVGALPYSINLRPNLIAKIHKDLVITNQRPYDPDLGSYYFNMGHMYP
ncbi:hypothetical protein [Chryseobacterium sp. GP-SGM7]|uniref:hypothetical protein n=1 Tax=Chryseobacterium sp. GP-SGM7 TaxID=3411323 RepID=UPI003B955750